MANEFPIDPEFGRFVEGVPGSNPKNSPKKAKNRLS
jgi:hypothetical protein